MDQRRSSWPALAFVGALATCVSWLGFHQLQADSYRLLYAGRWIAQHGFPYREMFTLAAGHRPFADQQWLAELTHYGAWRIGGDGGVVLASVSAFAAAFMLLFALIRHRGGSVVLAICCVIVALFGTLTASFVRAQTFALPLFVALLWLCLDDAEADRVSGRAVLVLPLLALWANLHGSVLMAAGLAVAYFAYRTVRLLRRGKPRAALAYAALAAAAALTPLATPYGAHVLVYYHQLIGNPALGPADVEWHPPWFREFSLVQFLVPIVLAWASTIAVVIRHRRPPLAAAGEGPSPVAAGAVALTAVAAGMELRNNIWLGIAAAVLIGDTAKLWLPHRPIARAFGVGLGATATSLAAIAAALFTASAASDFQADTPLRAVAATATYAASHPCAHVLGDDLSVSALLWLDPAVAGRVGFDGELEAYPPAALVRWINFETVDTPGWFDAARNYQLLIASATDQPTLVRRLALLRDASVLAHDPHGIALVHEPAAQLGCPPAPIRAPIAAPIAAPMSAPASTPGTTISLGPADK